MVWKTLLLLFVGLLLPGGLFADDPRELLIGLDSGVIEAIVALDSPEWRDREAATLWLIESADRWVRRVPAEFRPESPEASWRWHRIGHYVAELAFLPTTLRQQQDAALRGKLTQLREETGRAFNRALVDCLCHPDIRVRSRAVEQLGETHDGRYLLRESTVNTDRSARVRESLYDVARRSDREWAFELIRMALDRDRDEPITAVAARAAQSLGDVRILPTLRKRFLEGTPPHPEVILALVAFGRPEDSQAVDVLLRSGEYRQISAALDSLGTSRLRRHLGSIAALLASEHWDLRVRALRRLEEVDRTNVPFHLLQLLDHPDLEVYHFAVEHLMRLGGEDFLGDIEVSLRRWPPAERPFFIASEEGRAFPRALPALRGRGVAVPVGSAGAAPGTPAKDR